MLSEVFRQARALSTLGDRPLVVLASAENARDTDGWTEAQERMAALSTNAVTDEAPASHAGMVEDTQGASASVRAITSVVRTVRLGTPLDDPLTPR